MMESITTYLSNFQIGLLSFPLIIAIIFLRIPIAVTMFGLGLIGTYLIAGDLKMINSQLKTFAFGTFSNYSLSIIPLFLLMGEFSTKSGMSNTLFKFVKACLGHRSGGMVMATIGASAGFGAICGSSLATTSAMTRVAYPELRKAGFSGALSTGALAAGGTLGILIPPSMVLVIYAILAEENIEKLFTAAFIPGILAICGYILTILIYTKIVPNSGKRFKKVSFKERWHYFKNVWATILIFTLVLGGIYTGAFSPTAAAAVGAAGTGLVAWSQKKLSLAVLQDSLLSTAKTSAMIFFIILSAGILNSFLSSAKVPQTLAEFFIQSSFNPWSILISMLILYIILGTVMDSLAMIFLTIPIFSPIITQLDFGIPPSEVGIWFGILVLMSAEIGLITPPVGMNIFVINTLAKDTPIVETYRGVLPFIISDVIRIILLVAFPFITLFAVRLFY